MKKLMLTTAMLVAAGSAMAQQTTLAAPGDLFRAEADPTAILASDLIGMRVYAAEAAPAADELAGIQTDWEDIGEINDVILSRAGSAEAVLVDIGGFLGIGERQIAVDMSAIRFVSDSATQDSTNDYFLVLNASRAVLEAAPQYAGDRMTQDVSSTTQTTPVPTDPDYGTVEDSAMGEREPIMRDGYAVAEAETLTTEKLTGARVYDANDAWIGDVSELIVTEQGQITDAVIDVGGFLGIGAKAVALKLSDVDILRDADGDEVRLYVSMTKEQLEALPTFEG